MKFSIKDFFSKCDQNRRKVRIWSHLLKNSFMENFVFCAVSLIDVWHQILNMPLYIHTLNIRKPCFCAKKKQKEKSDGDAKFQKRSSIFYTDIQDDINLKNFSSFFLIFNANFFLNSQTGTSAQFIWINKNCT